MPRIKSDFDMTIHLIMIVVLGHDHSNDNYNKKKTNRWTWGRGEVHYEQSENQLSRNVHCRLWFPVMTLVSFPDPLRKIKKGSGNRYGNAVSKRNSISYTISVNVHRSIPSEYEHTYVVRGFRNSLLDGNPNSSASLISVKKRTLIMGILCHSQMH